MPEDPKVEIAVEPEEKDTSQEPVEIPQAEPKVSSEEQLAAKIKADFDALYGSRLKQVEDRLHGAYRIQERLQRENEELKRSKVQPLSADISARASTGTPDSKDPWATIQDGHVWKSEIEKLAEQKAAEIVQKQEALKEAQAEVQRQEAIREHWKQSVQTKYPDLGPDGDPNSQVSITFNEVLNEHPEYLRNPFGPRLAMEDMEAKLQDKGITASTPTGNQEVVRRSRAAVSSTPASRTTLPASTKQTITREQKALCDRLNIPYDRYLEVQKALETNGGIELS